jgi:nucleotide-binding universal stress UspA family protein
MLQTRKILVGLDGSEQDATLISFINYILKSSPVEHIYFLNVISKVSHLADDNIQAKKIDDAAIHAQKDKLRKKIEEGVEHDDSVQIHLEVIKGNVLKEFLRFQTLEDIDIIIAGRKKNLKGSGSLNRKLARRAACNLIVVPEDYNPGLKKLIVPVDVAHFNVDALADYSKQALDYAIYISRSNNNEIEIICQNVYAVPSGFHTTGKSFEEFGDIMKENCRKSFETWLEGIDHQGVPITPVYDLKKDRTFGEIIHKTANEHNANGVIIGAKGRSAASSLFMSCSAEDLIRIVDYLPLTIVRPKGVTSGLFASMREL